MKLVANPPTPWPSWQAPVSTRSLAGHHHGARGGGWTSSLPRVRFLCRRQRGRLWVDCTGREGRGRMFYRTHLLLHTHHDIISRSLIGRERLRERHGTGNEGSASGARSRARTRCTRRSTRDPARILRASTRCTYGSFHATVNHTVRTCRAATTAAPNPTRREEC